MRSFFGLVFVATVIVAQPLGAQTRDIDRAGARVTALADEYEREFKRTFPALAELYGFTDIPRNRFDANTKAALRAWRTREDRWAIELDRIDGAALWGRTEWVTYGYLREALAAAQGLRGVPHGMVAGTAHEWLAHQPPHLGRGPTSRHPRSTAGRHRALVEFAAVARRRNGQRA